MTVATGRNESGKKVEHLVIADTEKDIYIQLGGGVNAEVIRIFGCKLLRSMSLPYEKCT